ncbi:hypothetical protein WMY93_002702 [Mugilogobius chulae]|uniref:FYVE-type domain-containing protein n=1 Tax=Mugilogobius chulae TaxID=88201 RepID=A0AAW0Q0E3_9GOBI
MAKVLTFDLDNRARIKVVEESFGPSGKPLYKPGRILMGEGRLLKQNRKKRQPKVFFLFNDVIVYGSIIVNGRWYKKQKIIPLGKKRQTGRLGGYCDPEESMANPYTSKSFYVAAPTPAEKLAWMDHIKTCTDNLLQQGVTSSTELAPSWMPDSASDICLVCEAKFTHTYRRHHCRMCGILVCHKCCKDKALIGHISATKKQKVCTHCYSKKLDDVPRSRGNSEEDDPVESSDEEDEEVDENLLYMSPSSWLDSRMGTWGDIGQYMSMRPVHS